MAVKSRRRRRRRNAAPGKLPVGVKSYSRGKPKRRRRKAKAKANPGRRRRAKKTSTRRRRSSSRKGGKRRRRRAARKNPTRRRRARSNTKRRRRRSSRKNKGTRRRRRSSRKNKGTRRRRARRNGGTRRRARRNSSLEFKPTRRRRKAKTNGGRRRRARRNSGGGFRVGGAVSTVKSELKKLLEPQSWLPAAAHGALGIGFAFKGPDMLAQYTGRFGLMNVGYGGVALSAISTALGAGLTQVVAGMIPGGRKGIVGDLLRGIGRDVFVGGAIWTAIRLVQELLPTSSLALQLPSARGGMSGMYGMAGLGAYGTYPGQYPSYAPLGVVTSPEELIAGESLARQIGNEGGMGQPVPIQDFRGGGVADWMELSGMRGMNNWVEFHPDTGIAMEQFAPGVEAF